MTSVLLVDVLFMPLPPLPAAYPAWAWAASETEQQAVSSMVSLIIEWAVTPYRSGPYRVLVAVDLLDLLRTKTAVVGNRCALFGPDVGIDGLGSVLHTYALGVGSENQLVFPNRGEKVITITQF